MKENFISLCFMISLAVVLYKGGDKGGDKR